MNTTLIFLSVGTILCALGFGGWVLELVGWEEKKMKEFLEEEDNKNQWN